MLKEIREKREKKISIIIAAAGGSTRFGSNKSKPKQFMHLNGKSLLLYSLEKFSLVKNITEIIIITSDVSATNELLGKKDFFNGPNLKVILGGELRQDSVYNGFCNLTPGADLVIIHDVARPLFDIKDVEKCIEKAYSNKALVLAVPVVDTIKRARSHQDELLVEDTLNRENLYVIQTPQVFDYNLLDKAYKMYKGSNSKSLNQDYSLFTDEARMVELLGEPVNLVIGTRKNIKITYEEDLEIASAILNEKSEIQCLK
ncbi:MAG: 2-C-methyl-D-erythritol 4-phosphate cytidylyltransferase [Candidatus Melainabacteria bacterium]|nr:2-C-methyl-D-erythritol 4-phosphate cytidylyltransferase [Candidatus Melainabacteria bacterium]